MGRTNSILSTVAVGILILGGGCGKKSSSTTASQGSQGGSSAQTAAQLAGSGQMCDVDATLGASGSNFQLYGNTKILQLEANGTFSYDVFFSDHVGCTNSINSGGNDMVTYNLSGTFTVVGAASAPANATLIKFTVTSATVVSYGSTSDGGVTQALITWLNNSCGITPGLSTSVTGGGTLTGGVCVTTSGANGLAAVNLPNSGDVFENIVYNSNSTLQIGSHQDVWRPGQPSASVASSFSESYQDYQ